MAPRRRPVARLTVGWLTVRRLTARSWGIALVVGWLLTWGAVRWLRPARVGLTVWSVLRTARCWRRVGLATGGLVGRGSGCVLRLGRLIRA